MTVSAARAGVGGIAIDVLDPAGYQVLGTMPNHAYRSDGQLAPTTYFWQDLHGSDVPARDPS